MTKQNKPNQTNQTSEIINQVLADRILTAYNTTANIMAQHKKPIELATAIIYNFISRQFQEAALIYHQKPRLDNPSQAVT